MQCSSTLCVDSRSLPEPDVLRRLAVSESGFVFDAVLGHSYTVNDTGLALLRLLMRGYDWHKVKAAVLTEFDVDPATAERDIWDFVAMLGENLR